MEQHQYSMFYRKKIENEYLLLFSEYKYGIPTWSPLASAILTGKYNSGVSESSRFSAEKYKSLKDTLLTLQVGKINVKKASKLLSIDTNLDCTLPQLSIHKFPVTLC